jgi:hypothetical protein
VEGFFGQVLALWQYPESFPREYQVAYRPDPRELIVEYRLPPATMIPVVRDYRYVKARGERDLPPRRAAQAKRRNDSALAREMQEQAILPALQCEAGRAPIGRTARNGNATIRAVSNLTGN